MRGRGIPIVVVLIAAVVGAIVGAIAGIHYYNTHLGDWKIGATAILIGIGITAVVVVVVWLLWALLALGRAEPQPPAFTDDARPAVPSYMTKPGTPITHVEPSKRGTTNIVDVLASLGSIGAGIYLLQYQSAGSSETGTSWFEIIGHGIGIYFIAKGIFIARTAYLQAQARNLLEDMVDIARTRERRSVEATPPPPSVSEGD